MEFVKMHGIGNDYIYINAMVEKIENPSELAKKISDRHFGVGSDGIILIDKSDVADFKMMMWNADGSRGKMCGNGIRCVAKYVYEFAYTDKVFLTIETDAGIKRIWLSVVEDRVKSVQVDMGEPVLDPKLIPTRLSKDELINHELTCKMGKFNMTTVSMGNPHSVMFVDEMDTHSMHKIGKALEVHEAFPDRANIEFITVLNRKSLKMRVWERGAGETLACGTGACAAVVAGVLNGLCDREVDIELLGGSLHIEWCQADNKVYMTGPAEFVCSGVWPMPNTLLRPKREYKNPVNADISLSSDNLEV